MDKYCVFRMMLDFMADEAEVTDADMNWLGNAIKITGETEDQVIEIEVTIKKKEEKKDA